MDRQLTPGGDRSQAPWLRNTRWAGGAIRDQSGENLHLIWIFTIVWNVLTILALLTHLKGDLHASDKSSLLALIFPAIGLGLLLWACGRTWRIVKFGASVFHLQTLPAIPGGDLAGTIHVARKFQSQSGIELRLVCIHRFMAGFGRHARVIDQIVWQESQRVDPLTPSDDGTDIAVLFHIPPDAKPTSDQAMGDGVRWRLEARCKTTGVSYFSRFDVPVFVVTASKFAAVGPAEPSDPRSSLGGRGIICERIGDARLRIYFAAARNKSSSLLPAVIGVALCAGALGLADRAGAGMERIITISIASVLLFFGGVFVFRAIFNWFVSDEIMVRYGSLTLERRAPMFRQEQTFKMVDVSDIFGESEDDSTTAASGSAQRKRFHSLMLKTRDGDLIRLGNHILHKDYAVWLAEEIKDTLGVVSRK